MVDDGRDPAADLAVAHGQKGLNLGVVVKRMVPVAQQPAVLHQQRRDPVGVALVQLPREIDELLLLAPEVDRFDDHTCR